jgi:phosphonopyruvate decarboxylase
VGGPPTVAHRIDFRSLSQSVGYAASFEAVDEPSLLSGWGKLRDLRGPIFLEVKVGGGSRSNLRRPDSSPEANKVAFMEIAGG